MGLIVCIFLICGNVLFSACAKDGAIDISASKVLLIYPQAEFTVTSAADWWLESDGDKFEITPTAGVAGTTQVCVMYTHNEKRTECKEACLP